jgi:hypothetical protein
MTAAAPSNTALVKIIWAYPSANGIGALLWLKK